jgi:hypothetical protein
MPTVWHCFTALLLSVLMVAPVAAAQEVGKVAEVIGGVDILKGGKLPATPAQVGDSISQGDIIRTKSSGKVQIHFADDSVLTISPDSRVAINEFVYNPDTNQRQAHLKIFHGLVHTLVNKIFKKEAPDFTVETQTAVIGVRGTDYYTLVAPALSDIYNNSGSTEVRNVFAEIPGKVILKGKEFTQVARNLPPTLPMPLTDEDINWIKRQMTPQLAMKSSGGTSSSDAKLLSGAASASTGGQRSTSTVILTSSTPSQATVIQNLQSPIFVPPTPNPTPTPSGLPTPFQIAVSWGSGAVDLDLFLRDPQSKVYTYNNPGTPTGPVYYHVDSMVPNGGSVITVNRWEPSGVFTAGVLDFTNRNNPSSTVLSNSSGVSMQFIVGGTVSVVPIAGGSKAVVSGGTPYAPFPSITPPTGKAGNTWTAVQIDTGTGKITPVNTITP